MLRHKETTWDFMSRYIICCDYRGNPRMLSSIHNLLWIVAVSYKGLKVRNLFQLIFPLTWPLVAGCAGRPDVVESRGSSPPDSWYQHPEHIPAPEGRGRGYYGVIAGYQTLMVHQPGMTRITFQDSIYCYGNHNILYSTPTMQGWLHSAEHYILSVALSLSTNY